LSATTTGVRPGVRKLRARRRRLISGFVDIHTEKGYSSGPDDRGSICFILAFMELRSLNARMIQRRKAKPLTELLDSMPAVALLGPRQVGKTTLALEIGDLSLTESH